MKRDGSRQEFNRDKVLDSMLIACRKRRVPMEDLEAAVNRIERNLFQDYDQEVDTKIVGEMVMDELQSVDTVAYVRFASVYREFESLDDFREIVTAMKKFRGAPARAEGAQGSGLRAQGREGKAHGI